MGTHSCQILLCILFFIFGKVALADSPSSAESLAGCYQLSSSQRLTAEKEVAVRLRAGLPSTEEAMEVLRTIPEEMPYAKLPSAIQLTATQAPYGGVNAHVARRIPHAYTFDGRSSWYVHEQNGKIMISFNAPSGTFIALIPMNGRILHGNYEAQGSWCGNAISLKKNERPRTVEAKKIVCSSSASAAKSSLGGDITSLLTLR